MLINAAFAGEKTADFIRQICEKERENDRRTCGKLLMVPAGYSANLSKYKAECIVGHLIKPIKQSELLNKLMETLHPAIDTEWTSVKPQARPAGTMGRALKILLVEDNLVNQKLAVRLLEKAGHSVEIANHGEEALALLQNATYDIIFMDVQMPVMGGFETTKRIREMEQASGEHVPIIAMTAHALKGDREKCLAAGMDGYISKPIQSEELYQAIVELTARAPVSEVHNRV